MSALDQYVEARLAANKELSDLEYDAVAISTASHDQAAEYFQKLGSAASRAIKHMEGAEPPESLRIAHSAYMSALHLVVQATSTVAQAIRSNDEAFVVEADGLLGAAMTALSHSTRLVQQETKRLTGS